jgi:hypothetical protein
MKEIKISRGEEWIDDARSYTLKLSTGQQINLIKGETKSIKVDKFPATITAAISMGLGRSKEIVIDCNTSEIKVKGSKFFNGFTILIPLIFGPLLRPVFEANYSWPPNYLIGVVFIQLLWLFYSVGIKKQDWIILEKVNG